jgi:hypothetical protein
MNVPLLSYLVNLIEEMMTKDGPVVGKAVGKAAATAAIASAQSDPKVQAITAASVAFLAATQDLKAAVNEHPDAPEIIPATK